MHSGRIAFVPMLACIGRLPPPAPSVPRRCYVPGSTIRASMVAAKPPVVKSFDAERNWNDIWHTVESEDRQWSGFVGVWSRFAAEQGRPAVLRCDYMLHISHFPSHRQDGLLCDGVHQKAALVDRFVLSHVSMRSIHAGDKLRRESKGLRCFRPCGDENFEQMNVYSADNGGCKQRESDGNFQKTWTYNKEEHNKDDGWFHPFMVKDGPFRGRCVCPSPGKTTSVTFSLPLKELRGEGVPQGPLFAEEFFLRAPNEDRAWSGSPLYDVNSGAASALYCIREKRVVLDPTQPIAYDALDIPEARPPLNDDPARWLQGAWTSKREQIRWEADGRMMQVWEVPTENTFRLVAAGEGHVLTLLPDSMYLAYPAKVPTAAAEVPEAGVAIEMGGFVRLDGTMFRRQIVHYNKTGQIDSVTYEEWQRQAE